MSEIVITIRQSDTKAIEFLNKLKARKAEIKAQTQNKTYSSIFKNITMKEQIIQKLQELEMEINELRDTSDTYALSDLHRAISEYLSSEGRV